MNPRNPDWRNGQLPPDTALFVIGDIHAYDTLLASLLAAIQDRIVRLPRHVHKYVVFVGDYIDRGPNTPGTIDRLLDFERDMGLHSVTVTFLCGNHDEYFARLLKAPKFTERVLADPSRPNNYMHLMTDTDGTLSQKGFDIWLSIGGGAKTVKDYVSEADVILSNSDGLTLDDINALVKKLNSRVPEKHKKFFQRLYNHAYLIVGDYLLVHAGIDPQKSLRDQGIEGPFLPEKAYMGFLMIRDSFLWANELPLCPYVVVHGHTPSEVTARTIGEELYPLRLIADGQKNWRLGLDTGVYKEDGGLTCFMRYGTNASFLTVSHCDPSHVLHYEISPAAQDAAR